MTDPIPVEGQSPDIFFSTPLTVIGIFVAILREHFSASEPDPPLKWSWNDSQELTQLFIESGFNKNNEARGKRPGVWVDRDQTSYGQAVVGNQDQVPTIIQVKHDYYYARVQMDMVIDCTSRYRGESMMVGSVVQDFLQMSSVLIQRYFGFRSISPIILNKTVPYEQDQDLMSSQIQFRVEYEARWTTLPILPVLRGISMRIADVADPDQYFRDMTLRG